MEATAELSSFVYETGYDDIPKPIVQKAKLAVLDALGIALRGSLSAEASLIRPLLASAEPSGEASVVATRRRSNPQWAAFANAVMINSLELDDTCDTTFCHPATTTVPAVLAIAEQVNASGKEFLAAIVLAYEVTLRIARAACSHRAQGFGVTGTTGAFGAAVGVAKILGLSKKEMVSVLGLAGTLAPLSLLQYLFDGSMSKTIYAGAAAYNAINAALLAAQGITGPRGILDGEFGFLAVASGVENDSSQLVDKLGKDYLISSVSTKPYACCRHFHAAIDCLLKLRKQNQMDWLDDVVEITICSHHLAIKGHDCNYPTTVVAAQQSFPYCIAVALLEGHVNIDDFQAAKIKDKHRYILARKVQLIENGPTIRNALGKTICIVEIKLADGNNLQCVNDSPKGSPEKPLSLEEYKNKFINLTKPLIDKEQQLRLLNAVFSLEMIAVRDLGRLLGLPGSEETI